MRFFKEYPVTGFVNILNGTCGLSHYKYSIFVLNLTMHNLQLFHIILKQIFLGKK